MMEQYIEQENEDIEHGVTIQQVVEITCQTDPIGCTSVLLGGMVEIIQAQDLEIPIPEAPPSSEQDIIVDDQVNLASPQATWIKKKKAQASFKRNKPKLLDGLGYTYNVKRTRGLATDWQCTVRSKALTCRAIVKQQNGTFTPGPQPHLHFAEPGISSRKLENLTSPLKKDKKMTAKMMKAMKGKKAKSKGRKGSEKQYYSNYVFGQPRLIEKRTGHTYNFKKSNGDTAYWNCSLNSKSFKCKATLKQKNGEFTAGSESHCHVGRGNTTSTTAPKMLVKTPQCKRDKSITKQAWDIVNAKTKLPNPCESQERELSEEAYAAGFRILQAATHLSRPRLIDSQGFTYNIKRARRNTVEWQCTIRGRKMCCLASYKEIDGRFTAGPHAHLHTAKPGVCYKTKVAAKIRAKALSDLFQPTSEIVNEVLLQEVAEKPSATILKPDNLTRMASRARQASKAKFVNDILYGVAGFKPHPGDDDYDGSDDEIARDEDS
ncbi:uncharacterized protein LOC117289694 [Asterias rubens]|uniref:uncharacterized protein LOC117289694 n=1 Tax=Asterias rubens TaxID=7604 RepID=UPI0014552130|nr:uncharacterized protein LOC117289694 [Asterias rubens]